MKQLKDGHGKLHSMLTRVRGARDSLRRLEAKLAAETGWNDLIPEAQARRLAEARATLRDGLAPEMHEVAPFVDSLIGDSGERLSTPRYFREARAADDTTQDLLTRLVLANELPLMRAESLAAMATDAAARGGEAAAAILVRVEREIARRGSAVPQTFRAEVAVARWRFPLPPELIEERELVASIQKTADAIATAWSEIRGGAPDTADRIERYTITDAAPVVELPEIADRLQRPERRIPTMTAPTVPSADQPAVA